MAVTLNVGALKTRESTSDPWQSSVIKSDAVTDANSITFDSSETYDAGTVGEELVSQKNTLDQLKTDTFGNINLTGTNNTGSTIATGTFFYNNGVLVMAKTDIQNGSAITIGTNAETVTVGGLNKLSVKTIPFSGTSTASGSLVTDLSPANIAIICVSETHNYRVVPWLYSSTKWALTFFDVSVSNIQIKSEAQVSGVIMYLEF